MMNMLCADEAGTYSVRLTAYERRAVQKRLQDIEVALGHPHWTGKQKSALKQERRRTRRQARGPITSGESRVAEIQVRGMDSSGR